MGFGIGFLDLGFGKQKFSVKARVIYLLFFYLKEHVKMQSKKRALLFKYLMFKRKKESQV